MRFSLAKVKRNRSMKETLSCEEEVAELAISVTNELARCACNHCIDIYKRGEEEHFLSKANANEIQTKNAAIMVNVNEQLNNGR
jgi:predicted Zn-dependent protease